MHGGWNGRGGDGIGGRLAGATGLGRVGALVRSVQYLMRELDDRVYTWRAQARLEVEYGQGLFEAFVTLGSGGVINEFPAR